MSKITNKKRNQYRTDVRSVASLLVFTTLLSIDLPVMAEEEAKSPEIIGDRPDFTESSATIPPIHLQGELGVAYSTIGDSKVFTIPNLLLRLGVIDHLEARIGVPSYEASFLEDEDSVVTGIEIGLKTAFNIGEKAALGLLPYAVIPVYEDEWIATGLELGLKGLWSVDLTDFASLGGNIGVIFEGVAPPETEFETTYLASLSFGMTPIDWFGIFIEVYALIDHTPEILVVSDGGFTFLVAPWLQLDIFAAGGLTPDAQGFEVGGGAIFLI